MTINLKKGQRISLSKEAPGLTKLMCGLGWNVAKKSGGGIFGIFDSTQDFDLDSSALCLDKNDKLRAKQDVIYYGNLKHKSGAIIHQGDNLTGAGDGDDEVILVDLTKIPQNISKIVFAINIYKCIQRKQHFGLVENAFVRLVDGINNKELARYNLSGENYGNMTGMVLAEIYRHNDEWKMAAIGNGLKADSLQDIIRNYT